LKTTITVSPFEATSGPVQVVKYEAMLFGSSGKGVLNKEPSSLAEYNNPEEAFPKTTNGIS
jgi:hypothetical protein